MEKFIRNNWFVAFIAIFIVMLIVLSGLGIFLNNGILGFFWGGRDDKRLDVMSSVILASVSFASALVAIILARTALLFAENEEKREFKNKIEERVKDINKRSHKITLEARKIGVNVMNHFEQPNNSSFKNDFVDPDLLKDELKKIKDELNKIQDEASFFMVYKRIQIIF